MDMKVLKKSMRMHRYQVRGVALAEITWQEGQNDEFRMSSNYVPDYKTMEKFFPLAGLCRLADLREVANQLQLGSDLIHSILSKVYMCICHGMPTDPTVLLQGRFNQVLGVVVPTISLCDAKVPRTFAQVHKILYKYPIACTMAMTFGLDITSVNFWEELATPSTARDRLESFLLLIDAMLHHTYMLHV